MSTGDGDSMPPLGGQTTGGNGHNCNQEDILKHMRPYIEK